MAWFVLIVAGLLEVAWAVCLKRSDGLTRTWPSVAFLVTSAASVYLLGLSLKSLPLGTAYAVWTGIGAAGTVCAGIFLFAEPASIPRLFFVAVIVAAIVGLKLSAA